MRVKSLVGFWVIAVVLAATSFSVSAGYDSARSRSNDVVKTRPDTASNNAQKYRPKRGCFATGTRDTSGNPQVTC